MFCVQICHAGRARIRYCFVGDLIPSFCIYMVNGHASAWLAMTL